MKKMLRVLFLSLMLFGCTKTNVMPPENTEITLIRLTEAQQHQLSKKQQQILAKASEDIRLILEGQEPKNAKFYAGKTDGGTLWYKSDDYDIGSWRALGTFMGHDGYTKGVTIKFSEAIFKGNWENLSYTWFESF